MKPNNSWEIEFDNFMLELTDERKWKDGRPVIGDYVYLTAGMAIKDFITKTLQQQREDDYKKFEEIIGEDVEISRIDWKEDMGEFKEAQNDLRQEQRDKLQSLKQENK